MFILTNFTEMNKLWVRLQYQGHSRENEKRIQERKDLRTIIGTNFVRLSELKGLDLNIYTHTVLHTILEQIIQCRDSLAQEYLMEVIIQVFPDDLQVATLDLYLEAASNLQPQVSIKQIFTALTDRLTSYVLKLTETTQQNVRDQSKLSYESEIIQQMKVLSLNDIEDFKNPFKIFEPKFAIQGLPANTSIFENFWKRFINIHSNRPSLLISEIVVLLMGLCNLALNCYPDRVDYVDIIFVYLYYQAKKGLNSSIQACTVKIYKMA